MNSIRKLIGKEYLTEVSIYSPATYTYKVLVNVNGTEKGLENLESVKLKDGESETFGVGYHTIEFEHPIEILSDEFLVVILIENENEGLTYYCMETDELGEEIYKAAQTNYGKCLLSIDGYIEYGEWIDLSDKTIMGMSADSTIKAFTINGSDIMKGDVKKDNEINQKDAKLVLKAFANKVALTNKEKIAADVNGDKEVNQKDAKLILKYFANKITEF